jgi:ribosomal protein S18 acetylase RimI-like enzyme
MSRPYQDEADLEAITDLLLSCRAADRIDKWPTIAELRVLCDPSNTAWDRHVWIDAGGELAGFALVDNQYGSFYFWTHPAIRDNSVDLQMIDWALELRRASNPSDSTLRCMIREDDVDRIELVERLGFTREELFTIRMARLLHEPIPEPKLPEGFTVRHVAGEHEVEEYVAMHRDAFGTTNMTAEHRLAAMRDPGYLPELDLIAVAPDGTFAAFCVCSLNQDENARSGRREGWTDPIGTRPAFRRQGLASAVISEGLRRLHAHGLDTALLGTGSWNTAAQRCFGSVGFRPLYNIVRYARDTGTSAATTSIA